MKKSFSAVVMALFAMQPLIAQTTDKASVTPVHPALEVPLITVPGLSNFITVAKTFKWDEKEAYGLKVHQKEGYLTLKRVKAGDQNLPEGQQIEIPLYKGEKVNVKSAFSLGRKVYLGASSKPKKSDITTILFYQVDLERSALLPNPYVVDTFAVEKGKTIKNIIWAIEDEGVVVSRRVTTGENISEIYFTMYDKSFKKIWQCNLGPHITKNTFYTEECPYQKGRILVTGIEYPDGVDKAMKKGKINYKYHLLLCDAQGVKSIDVNPEDYFVSELMADFNGNNQVICSGFYSQAGPDNLAGCFYMRVNAETKEVEKMTLNKFDVESQNFDVRKLYCNADGSALLLSEDFYVGSVTSTMNDDPGDNTSPSYIYRYDDIVAIKMNNDGKLEWKTHIDKKIASGAMLYPSFAHLATNDKWVFIFNENLKNLEPGSKGRFKAGEYNSAPVMVVLGQNGTYTKKEILAKPADKNSLMLNTTGEPMRLDDGSYIVEINKMLYRLDLKI